MTDIATVSLANSTGKVIRSGNVLLCHARAQTVDLIQYFAQDCSK